LYFVHNWRQQQRQVYEGLFESHVHLTRPEVL
jgi:hypothetical protein